MDTDMEPGWAGLLAERLCSITWTGLPDPAREAARLKLLHALGVSLAHGDLPASRAAWRAFGHSRGDSLGFGQMKRLAAEDAAFLNATIGHGSLLEDCGPGGLREGSHPGTFIIPAALAMAEDCNADCATLLTAMVVGYEAVGRIGFAGPAEIVQRRFRPLGVMGAFGAAAAAARVMGASPAQMAAALSIAAITAGGTTQGIREGTMDAYFEAGFAARNGIAAARLAMAGVIAARQSLEGEFGFFLTYGGVQGKRHDLLADRPDYGIQRVGLKRFAACLQNQLTVALIVDGLDRPLTVDEIGSVTIARGATGTHGLNSPGVSGSAPFPNMLSAQMSARFTAAAALLGRPVDNPGFFAAHHDDSDILAVTQRIELVAADPDRVDITIVLRNGAQLTLGGLGSDVLFPSPDLVAARFISRASAVMTPSAATALCETIRHLDGDRAARALTALIARDLSDMQKVRAG